MLPKRWEDHHTVNSFLYIVIALIISFLVTFLVYAYASLPEYAYTSVEFYGNGAIRKRRNDAILFDVYLEIPAHVISYSS